MYEKITPALRAVMQLSNKKATELRHEYIGTEHVLLALCEAECRAANLIRANVASIEDVRSCIMKVVKTGPEMVSTGKLPQTPRVKKAFEYAMEEAKLLHQSHIGTEHMLFGLLREGEGVAAVVLADCGFTLDKARDACRRDRDRVAPDAPADRLNKAELEIAVTALETSLLTAGSIIETLTKGGCQVHLDVWIHEGTEQVSLHDLNGELEARVFRVEKVLPRTK